MAATTIFPYHSIGDLTYDADIGDVILMVKAHHNPDDVMIQSALFNYYISKILSYLDLTKDYLMSPQIIEDRRNRSFHATNILININISEARTNFDTYTQLVLDRINKLKENFEQDSRCDVIKISKIFSFISQVGCGSFNPRFKIYNANRILYPLPNVTGIFGINTYLYALIHGVNIIGVPVKAENFDYVFGCPWTFMMHDIDHEMSIRSLFKGVDSISRKRMKTIYNIIVTDPNLNNLQKQCVILYLWWDIHEDYNVEFYLTGEISGEFIRQPWLEIEDRKFTDFTETPDNLESLAEFTATTGIIITSAEWYARRYLLNIIKSI